MIKKYRKKPVIIEAIQWTGKNLSEIDNFMGGIVENKETTLVIHTLEGDMEASIGDANSINTASGDVDCHEVKGSVHTMSGDVTCGDIAGSVNTMSGNVYRK